MGLGVNLVGRDVLRATYVSIVSATAVDVRACVRACACVRSLHLSLTQCTALLSLAHCTHWADLLPMRSAEAPLPTWQPHSISMLGSVLIQPCTRQWKQLLRTRVGMLLGDLAARTGSPTALLYGARFWVGISSSFYHWFPRVMPCR
jgi:hypothetical protein